jgi:hypothetical protein
MNITPLTADNPSQEKVTAAACEWPSRARLISEIIAEHETRDMLLQSARFEHAHRADEPARYASGTMVCFVYRALAHP